MSSLATIRTDPQDNAATSHGGLFHEYKPHSAGAHASAAHSGRGGASHNGAETVSNSACGASKVSTDQAPYSAGNTSAAAPNDARTWGAARARALCARGAVHGAQRGRPRFKAARARRLARGGQHAPPLHTAGGTRARTAEGARAAGGAQASGCGRGRRARARRTARSRAAAARGARAAGGAQGPRRRGGWRARRRGACADGTARAPDGARAGWCARRGARARLRMVRALRRARGCAQRAHCAARARARCMARVAPCAHGASMRCPCAPCRRMALPAPAGNSNRYLLRHRRRRVGVRRAETDVGDYDAVGGDEGRAHARQVHVHRARRDARRGREHLPHAREEPRLVHGRQAPRRVAGELHGAEDRRLAEERGARRLGGDVARGEARAVASNAHPAVVDGVDGEVGEDAALGADRPLRRASAVRREPVLGRRCARAW